MPAAQALGHHRAHIRDNLVGGARDCLPWGYRSTDLAPPLLSLKFVHVQILRMNF